MDEIDKDIAKITSDVFSSEKNMTKIAINILQGSAVTQNALEGLVIYRLFAIFLYSVYLPKIVKKNS